MHFLGRAVMICILTGYCVTEELSFEEQLDDIRLEFDNMEETFRSDFLSYIRTSKSNLLDITLPRRVQQLVTITLEDLIRGGKLANSSFWRGQDIKHDLLQLKMMTIETSAALSAALATHAQCKGLHSKMEETDIQTSGRLNALETEVVHLKQEVLKCACPNAKPSKKDPVSIESLTKPVNECTRVSVPNFSFETQSGWNGEWAAEKSEAIDGAQSARVTNGGANQHFDFPRPVRNLLFTAYSKIIDVGHPISEPADYSIHCDLMKPSGNWLWNFITPFDPFENNWQFKQRWIVLEKEDAIIKASCNLLYRDSAMPGAAFFDDVSLFVLPDDVKDTSSCGPL